MPPKKTLTDLATKEGIKNVPLTIYDGSAGPKGYEISKDASVTVMMWVKGKVKVAHGFSKSDKVKGATKQIVSDTGKILN